MNLTDPVLASRTFGVYLGLNGLAFFFAPGLVLAGRVSVLLSVFGLVDLAGASWTQYALHRTRGAASPG